MLQAALWCLHGLGLGRGVWFVAEEAKTPTINGEGVTDAALKELTDRQRLPRTPTKTSTLIITGVQRVSPQLSSEDPIRNVSTYHHYIDPANSTNVTDNSTDTTVYEKVKASVLSNTDNRSVNQDELNQKKEPSKCEASKATGHDENLLYSESLNQDPYITKVTVRNVTSMTNLTTEDATNVGVYTNNSTNPNFTKSHTSTCETEAVSPKNARDRYFQKVDAEKVIDEDEFVEAKVSFGQKLKFWECKLVDKDSSPVGRVESPRSQKQNPWDAKKGGDLMGNEEYAQSPSPCDRNNWGAEINICRLNSRQRSNPHDLISMDDPANNTLHSDFQPNVWDVERAVRPTTLDFFPPNDPREGSPDLVEVNISRVGTQPLVPLSSNQSPSLKLALGSPKRKPPGLSIGLNDFGLDRGLNPDLKDLCFGNSQELD